MSEGEEGEEEGKGERGRNERDQGKEEREGVVVTASVDHYH